MDDDLVPEERSAGMTLAHRVLPWVALVLIVWALAGFMSQFRQAAAEQAAQQAAAEASATAAAQASVETTVTGMTATVRTDLPLRSQPSTSTAVVATAREGSVLTVQAKKSSWFKVKDPAGHIGWVPNDAAYLVIKTK